MCRAHTLQLKPRNGVDKVFQEHGEERRYSAGEQIIFHDGPTGKSASFCLASLTHRDTESRLPVVPCLGFGSFCATAVLHIEAAFE